MSLSTKKWVVDKISTAALFDLSTDDVAGYFDKLKKLTLTIDMKKQREYGGDSGYAFHLTDQDSESSVQIEDAVMSYDKLTAATGVSPVVGAKVTPYQEKLTVASSSVTLTKAASMVTDSEKVIVATKGLTNSGVQLTRVASAPTAGQYTIASGVITFGDAGLEGKDVRVFYDYTSAATAETMSVTTTSKNKAYKFVAYGKAWDDELNVEFDVTIVIYKAQLLGTFTIDQSRKTATSNTLDLAILDPERSDGKVIDIIAA